MQIGSGKKMPRINLSGTQIAYELFGPAGAQCVAITPGGRFGMDSPGIRELGQALTEGGRRVLLWDRPNCGSSDICLEGASESDLQGAMLIKLIRALELGPTALVGGSAGSRTGLRAAVHDPSLVSHLIQLWISGGTISMLMLGAGYYGESAVAAKIGGMAAVAQTAPWSDLIKSNPRNREILSCQEPDRFLNLLERWADAFVPRESRPIPGMSADDLAKLDMPVLIFRSSPSDLFHPPEMSDRLHALIPRSQLVDLPWSDKRFVEIFSDAGRTGTGHFSDWPLLAPQILEFTARRDRS
jgi:pimeloyl-ACP methyl ester carboxylesterase